MRREIRETCDRIVKDISERLYAEIISGKMPKPDDLLTQQDLVDIKRRVFAIQGHGRVGMLPPVVTHNMMDGDHDEILQHIRRTGSCPDFIVSCFHLDSPSRSPQST